MDNYPLVLCLACLVVSKHFYSSFLAPLGLFALVWLPVLAIHRANAVDFYPLTDTALSCIIVMFISFLAGTLAGRMTPAGHVGGQISERRYSRYLKAGEVFLVMGCVGFALFIITNLTSVQLGAKFERMDRYGEGVYRPIRELIYSFGFPMLFSAAIIGMTLHARLLSFSSSQPVMKSSPLNALKQRFMWLAILSSLLLVAVDLLALGRIRIVSLLFFMMAAYICVSPAWKRIRATHIVIGLMIIGLIAMGLYQVTVWRGLTHEKSVGEWLLIYYSGALAYFNETVSGITDFQWGRDSLYSLEAFFCTPYNWVPVIRTYLPDVPLFFQDRQNACLVGPNIRYNAFGTLLLDGYSDAGVVGIAVLSFFLGLGASYLFRRTQRTWEPSIATITVFAVFCVLQSPLQWVGGMTEWTTIPIWLLAAKFYIDHGEKNADARVLCDTRMTPDTWMRHRGRDNGR